MYRWPKLRNGQNNGVSALSDTLKFRSTVNSHFIITKFQSYESFVPERKQGLKPIKFLTSKTSNMSSLYFFLRNLFFSILMWSFLRHNVLNYSRNEAGFTKSPKRLRRSKREADHLLPSSLEVKKVPGGYSFLLFCNTESKTLKTRREETRCFLFIVRARLEISFFRLTHFVCNADVL